MLLRAKDAEGLSPMLKPSTMTETMAQQPSGEAAAGANTDRRGARRKGVLLAARIDVQGTSLDCIVLDLSLRGARVQFGAPVALPEFVPLILRDGSRYDARRCWSRGNQVGLEFVSGASVTSNDAATRRARVVLERVAMADPAAWLPALRAERYFGDESLRQAAEAMEVAHLRLLAALRAHAGGS